MFFAGAVGMIGLSVLRFTTIDQESVHEVMMNVYYLVLGLLTIAINLKLQKVQENFRFMNYYWGKAVYCLFLASMAFSTGQEALVQYSLTIYFFLASCIFVYLAVADSETDKEQYKIDFKSFQEQNKDLFDTDWSSIPLLGKFFQAKFEDQVEKAKLDAAKFAAKEFEKDVQKRLGVKEVKMSKQELKQAMGSAF